MVLSRGDLNLDAEGLFTVCECVTCGHQYLNPRPTREHMPRYYQGDYDQHSPASPPAGIRARDKTYGHGKRLRLIERYVSGGRLIDVGCGAGGFLVAASARHHWDCLGIEPSSSAAEGCRRLGLDVLSASWEEADLPPSSADAVTMWEVIEHLHDPVVAVHKAAEVLRSGGILVVSTPNRDSLDARLFGETWVGYELPRHLQMFRQADLEGLMRSAGLTPVEVAVPGGAFFAFNTSLRFWLRHHRHGDFWQQVAFSLPARLIESPLFWLLGKLRLTSSLTTVGRKDT